jgi:hypothetical protein
MSCLSNKHIDFLFIIIPFTYSRQVVSNMEKYLLQLLFVHNISKKIKQLLINPLVLWGYLVENAFDI